MCVLRERLLKETSSSRFLLLYPFPIYACNADYDYTIMYLIHKSYNLKNQLVLAQIITILKNCLSKKGMEANNHTLLIIKGESF